MASRSLPSRGIAGSGLRCREPERGSQSNLIRTSTLALLGDWTPEGFSIGSSKLNWSAGAGLSFGVAIDEQVFGLLRVEV